MVEATYKLSDIAAKEGSPGLAEVVSEFGGSWLPIPPRV